MDTGKMMEPIVEELHSSATVRNVFGEPIEAHGKTVVPVANVAFGFGGGNGSGRHPKTPNKVQGEGGGVGGGVRVTPKGVLVVTDECTRFVRFDQPWKMLAAAGLGALWGFRVARKRAMREVRK
jgi:uncharacterized spore protein YtfJ